MTKARVVEFRAKMVLYTMFLKRTPLPLMTAILNRIRGRVGKQWYNLAQSTLHADTDMPDIILIEPQPNHPPRHDAAGLACPDSRSEDLTIFMVPCWRSAMILCLRDTLHEAPLSPSAAETHVQSFDAANFCRYNPSARASWARQSADPP
jgi:hypothetical protein